MSISGIEAVGFTPFAPPQVGNAGTNGTSAVAGGGATSGVQGPSGPNADFSDMVMDGLERLEGLNDRKDSLALQAATGDLSNIHDYTMAATEASVTTQLTVAVRNKALESFNEIMRMHVG